MAPAKVGSLEYTDHEGPSMTNVMRLCTICSDERLFEQPPCVEEHDPNCPEWVCVDCGAALLVGAFEAAPAAAVA